MLNSPRMDLARLWDPKVWAASSKDPALPDAALGFEAPIQYGKGGDWDYYSDGSLKPLMEPLPSGDVLVVAGNKTPWNGVRDWYTGIPVDRLPTAQVFKAATGRFEPADQPPTASPLHSADSDETALLSDGRIMVTSNYANARAYSGYSDNTIEPASYVASPNASTNDPFYDATGNSDTPGYLVNNQPYPFPVPADLRKPDIYDPSTGTWASPSPVAPCGVAQQTPVDANGVTTDWWEKYCYVLSKLPNGRVLAWTGGGGGTVGTRSGNSYDGRVYALDQTGWIQQAQQLGPRSATPQVDFNPIVLPPTGGILITGTACGANCNKVLVLNEHLLNNYDRIHGLVAQLFTPPPSP